MAGRKNQWSRQAADIEQNMAGGTDISSSFGLTTTGGIAKRLNQTVNSFKSFFNTISAAEISAINKIGSANEKATQKALIRSQKNIQKLADQNKKLQDKLQRESKSGSGFFSNIKFDSNDKGLGTFGKNVLSKFSIKDTIGEIGGLLGRVAPAITAIGSLAGIVGSLVWKLYDLGKASTILLKDTGGATGAVNSFNSSISEMSTRVLISDDQLRELSQSFLDAGMPVSQLNTHVLELVEASAKGVRMFELSSDTAAKWTRTLSMSGMTAAQIDSQWDSMAQTMWSFNGTIQDVNSSVEEGITAWSQYGANVGENVGAFQKGILKTRGLFKALNIDTRQAAQVMSRLYEDVDLRTKQAAFVGAGLGMSGAKAFNMMSDPENANEAVKMQITSALKLLPKMMGESGQYMKYSQAQLREKFGTDEAGQQRMAGVNRSKAYAMRNLESMGFDMNLVRGAMSQFQNYKGDADSFIPDMEKMQSQDSPESSIAKTLTSVNNTMPGLMNKLQIQLENLVTQVATKMMPFLTDKLMPTLNLLVDKISIVTSAITGGMDWIQNKLTPLFSDMFKVLSNPSSVPGASTAIGGALGAIAGGPTGNTIGSWLGRMFEKKGPPGSPGNPLQGGITSGASGSSNIWSSNSSDLDKYRAAQGIKMKGGHSHLRLNAALMGALAMAKGLDPKVAVATMMQESGGNESVAGDYGYHEKRRRKNGSFYNHFTSDPQRRDPRSYATSVGLYQLHDMGKGYGMSIEQRQNPLLNGLKAIPGIAANIKGGYGPGMAAARSQNPANWGAYARSVESQLPRAEMTFEEAKKSLGPLFDQIVLILKQNGDNAKAANAALLQLAMTSGNKDVMNLAQFTSKGLN